MKMFKSRWFLVFVVAMVAMLALAACEEEEEEPTDTNTEATEVVEEEAVATEEPAEEEAEEVAQATEEAMAEDDMGTIVDIAAGDEQFSTLVEALTQAELVETLQGDGPFTVFAPTNDAFEALPEGLLDSLLASPPSLEAVLLYHVVEGEVLAEQVVEMDGEEVPTVMGAPLTISVQDGDVFLNEDVQVVTTDIMASNGVIHVIDAVLVPDMPEGLGGAGAGADDAEMAATEEAMEDDAEMAATEEAMEDDADMAATEEAMDEDMVATEEAMDDDAEMAATEEAMDDDMAEDEMGTIVDIAVGDEQFSTLVEALTQAELVETLQGDGPFTVFAPTNEAFEALPPGMLDAVMSSPPSLEAVLLYHVVEGEVLAEQVVEMDGEEVPTVMGAPVTISVQDGDVFLNENVQVVMTDIIASNGVIHVIDAVLLPDMPEGMGDMGAADEDMAEDDAEMAATEEAMDDDAEMAATEEAMDDDMMEEEANTIADVVGSDARFQFLNTALGSAQPEIAETLAGEGPFTLFAPSNEGFQTALSELGIDPTAIVGNQELLSSLLLYHVVPGEVMAADVVELDGEMVETANGETVTITVDGETVMVNAATVVETDIEASNGVIHIIDFILVPPSAAEALGLGAEEEGMEDDAEMAATEEAMDDDAEMAATEEAMDEEDDAEMAAPEIDSICLITDVGRVNDGTFNQFAYEGMLRAAEDFDLQTTFIETVSPTDFRPNIETCVTEGFDIIVTVGFLMEDITRELAGENPETFFIGVDQFLQDGPENYVGVQFREDQAGFLVGVLAGEVTESNVLGGVYGVEIPPVIKFRNGFEQGVGLVATLTDREIEALGVYIDSFTSPDLGASTANQFIGDGADVIFGAGGPTGSGGITEAAQQEVFVIGVDQDEYLTTFGGGETPGAEFIISSATKRVDQGVYLMVEALVEGNMDAFPGGGVTVLDLSVDGVAAAGPNEADIDECFYETVNNVAQLIAEGELSTGVNGVTGELETPIEEILEGTDITWDDINACEE